MPTPDGDAGSFAESDQRATTSFVDGSTQALGASSHGTTESPSEPTVTPIPVEEPVSLRVLAVRGNNPPGLAVLDLSEGETTIYEMGVHALSADPVDGAVATPGRDWIIWSNGIAYRFSDSLDTIDVQLGPDPTRQIGGYAPALRVVPMPDGTRAWLIQPGLTEGGTTIQRWSIWSQSTPL